MHREPPGSRPAPGAAALPRLTRPALRTAGSGAKCGPPPGTLGAPEPRPSAAESSVGGPAIRSAVALEGAGQARARKSRGRGCYVYPANSWRSGCCWAVCSEGGSKLPAAAGGAPLAVSRGAAAREGAEGPEGLGRAAGRVGVEAGSGGLAVCGGGSDTQAVLWGRGAGSGWGRADLVGLLGS